MNDFLKDVMEGLSKSSKHLPSKYFYDEAGDKLFQQIMHSPEYYLTNCEFEIISLQCQQICNIIVEHFIEFDLVELGVGDGFKSKFLLKELISRKIDFSYFPVDISPGVIANLEDRLPKEIPGLKVRGLKGEYFNMLNQAYTISNRPKLILFLGANIGNMLPADALGFLGKLKNKLQENDLLLMGFDLKKNPATILAAYNDKAGLTRAFNLNLLKRINTELGANFDIGNFSHYPIYDPITGACKSYLISLKEQYVYIKATNKTVHFHRFEPINTEISQKYSQDEIHSLLTESGFETIKRFYDCKQWFTDLLCKISLK